MNCAAKPVDSVPMFVVLELKFTTTRWISSILLQLEKVIQKGRPALALKLVSVGTGIPASDASFHGCTGLIPVRGSSATTRFKC